MLAPNTPEKISRSNVLRKKLLRPKEKSRPPPCLFNGRSLNTQVLYNAVTTKDLIESPSKKR